MRFSFLLSVALLVAIIPAPVAGASEISGATVEKMVDAIYIVEGGPRAKKPFGILSVPCNSYAGCRKICVNTVRNNFRRWIRAGRPGEFDAFLAGRYCPVGAENDPRGLNRAWLKNFRSVYSRLSRS